MSSLFSAYCWDTLTPENIPPDTNSLCIIHMPRGPWDESKCHGLFAAVPHLTRLTFRHLDYTPASWTVLGAALLLTPHVNYLNVTDCRLKDNDLLTILNGCTLELCELNLTGNPLKFKNEGLIRRLQTFTNLQ